MRKWGLTTYKDRMCRNVQTTIHLLECLIPAVRGEITVFIGHQLKADAIKITDFLEKIGI